VAAEVVVVAGIGSLLPEEEEQDDLRAGLRNSESRC
jgi:hypothetical protein